MEIVYKKVDELIEYKENPRNNEAAVPKVVESIENFEFINPIAITADNVIISGHTRLKAAKTLGIVEVPCIILDLNEEDARLARIIDNKSNEYSTWDVTKLQSELDTLPKTDMTFFSMGKTYRDMNQRMENLEMIFGKVKIPITEDEYKEFEAMFNDYVDKNSTYLGFIGYLLEGKNAENCICSCKPLERIREQSSQQ